MRRLWIGTAAAAVAIALLAIVAAMFGHSPAGVLRVLAEGAFGSALALRGTVLKAAPLLLTGLCVVMAFRAGVWNIGAEGQFITGAIAAWLASPYGVVASLVAACVAGALWASIATVLRLWRNAPEVLTTILLNFVALHLLGWCVNGPLRERSARYPQTDPAGSALPAVMDIHGGVVVALAVGIGCWWLLYRTTEGLRLRATGLNPSAARYTGINVPAQIARAMALSGAIAGLAGGIELLGVTHRLFERFAAGHGYSGIAVALLAGLHPLGALLSSLFFGALATGAGELQRSAGIPAAIATFGQAVVILAVVAAGARKRLDA
ncbi:MAG TPA: ABC transporter permease [Thermoanaerobaculia bacterium]|nr:ABC transporter permease [Thermoanaerobaculia bacterium]